MSPKSINDILLENCKAIGSTNIPFSGSGNFYGSAVPIYTSMDAWDRAMDSWYGGSNSQLADAARKLGDPSQSSLVMAAVRFLGSVLPEPQLQAKKPAEGTDGQKGDSVVIPDHPMVELWDKPNEFYSGSTLKKAIAFSWVLKGEAFIIKVWNKGHSEVKELWYEPHWTIRPVWPIDGSEFISGYEVNRNGQWYPLEIDDVIHLRDGIDPYNPRSGLCGLISITRELYGDQEVSGFYSSLVSGSAVPPFLVSIDQGMQMSDDRMREFQRDLVRNTTGDKRGQPVVTKAAKAYKLGWSPTEMNLTEARYMPEDRFCAVMGIPAVVMELGTGHAHCLPADTRIATVNRGPVRISEVTAQDSVWSMTDGGLIEKPVVWSGQTGVLPVFKIKTRNRTIRASANHPLLTVRFRKAEFQHQTYAGTRITTQQRYECHLEWVAVKDLRIGDRIVEAAHLPDIGGAVASDGTPVSHKLMQWLGAFVGDGSMCDLASHSTSVSLAIPVDDRVGREYRILTKNLFTKQINGSWQRSDVQVQPVSVYESINGFGFCSKSAISWLTANGFKGGARTKRIPSWVFGLTDSLRLAFLRGLLDTDGSVDKTGRAVWRMASKWLVYDIRDLCIGLGMNVSNVLYVRQRGLGLPNKCKESFYDSWQFGIMSADDVKRIGSQDHKYKSYLNGTSAVKRVPLRTRKNGNDALPLDCETVKIQSITEEAAEPVYDLTIQDSHNFVADGLVVHNSIYNNVNMAMERAYRSYVVPLLKHIEEELQTQLLTDFEEEGSKVFLRHDLSKIQALQEDEDAKAARLDRLYRAGIIKRSEARSAGGYGPSDPANKEECDNVFFVPTGGTLVRPGEEPLGSGEQIIDMETGEVRAGGPPPAPELPPGAQEALAAAAGNGKPKELPAAANGQKPKPKLLKPAPPAAKAMPSGNQTIKQADSQEAIRWLKRNRFEQAAQMLTAKSVTKRT